MKLNTIKTAFVLCLAMALSLFLGACSGEQEAGNTYDVTIQAYDRNDAAIDGAACELTLACQSKEE